MKLNLSPSPCINLNSKWIKDLGIRPETLHPRRQSRPKSSSCWLRIRLPQQDSQSTRINKWDELKLKPFSQQRIQSRMWRESLQSGRKSFPHTLQIQHLSPKFIKNLQNFTPKIQRTQSINGPRNWTDTLQTLYRKKICRWLINIQKSIQHL